MMYLLSFVGMALCCVGLSWMVVCVIRSFSPKKVNKAADDALKAWAITAAGWLLVALSGVPLFFRH